ncbi:MAG: MBL fold metallo-hydrolase [Candidatus Nanoarchaeia archaeon]
MVKVTRLNHSAFLLEGSKRVFVDPFNINTDKKADYIFITHPHFDHCSIRDINKILTKDTVVVMPYIGNASQIGGNCIKLKPWQEIFLNGVRVKTIPSYNVEKQYHPKINGWLGYVINLDGEQVYHAGDTDFIEEMSSLKNITYALLPVCGTYTMGPKMAAKAANLIKPSKAIPMHFNDSEDGRQAKVFKKACKCKVDII